MPNDPTRRALQLLSLLQTRRLWRAAELAERFEVTERTVRRDVDRLRDLGYPVDATTGTAGGYRLAAGAHLPPLVFDDDEAVAVVVGLRAAAGTAIAGIEDSSLQALAKVEQALPDRLRRRVSALDGSIISLQRTHGDGGVVDPDTLSVLASACRSNEEVRFEYRSRDRADSRRLVEPHQLLSADRLWYLIAWDLRRTDWRTFRLDRLSDVRLAGRRFAPRTIPGGDAAAYLASSVASMPRELNAIVAVRAPYGRIDEALSYIEHTALDAETDSCTIHVRANHLDSVVMAVARLALHAQVRILEPSAVADAVHALIGRLDHR
jgi:predicted DNA-binding transcriptional regulator YafY